jgi:hypothetical protein
MACGISSIDASETSEGSDIGKRLDRAFFPLAFITFITFITFVTFVTFLTARGALLCRFAENLPLETHSLRD